MKKHLIPLIVLMQLLISCKTPSMFQVACSSVSFDATYIVDVSTESKQGYADLNQIKLNAIEGILFRGLSGGGCVTQKPLLTISKSEALNNPAVKAIYDKSKGFNKYITGVENLGIKQEYAGKKPVSVSKYRVSVNKELLRADLTKSGAIKSLSNGF